MSKSPVLRLIASFLLLLGLGYWLFSNNENLLEDSLVILRKSDVLWLLVSLIAYFVLYLIRALRIRLVLEERSWGILDILRVVSSHNFWNIILPARTGEITFPLLCKKRGISMQRSLSALFVIRVFDVLSALLFGLFCFHDMPLALPFLCLLFLYLLFPIGARLCQRIFHIMSTRMQSTGKRKKAVEGLRAMFADVEHMCSGRLGFEVLLASIAHHLLVCLIFYFYFLALGSSLSFGPVLVGGSFSVLALVIPATGPLNLGSADLGWVMGFRALGVEDSLIVASAVLMHVMTFISVGLFFALFCLLPRIFRKLPQELV